MGKKFEKKLKDRFLKKRDDVRRLHQSQVRKVFESISYMIENIDNIHKIATDEIVNYYHVHSTSSRTQPYLWFSSDLGCPVRKDLTNCGDCIFCHDDEIHKRFREFSHHVLSDDSVLRLLKELYELQSYMRKKYGVVK